MSGPQVSVARLLGRVLALVVLGLASAATAASESDEAPEGVPPFHRVYVPVDQLRKTPWTQGYLPISADEFRRLVETVDAGAKGAPGSAAAEIQGAEYSARLVAEDLLVGTGTLQLLRRGAATDGPSAESWLRFDPCSLALGAADWQDQNARPAILGTGAEGVVRVLVEGSRLRCDWSLRGERTASGSFNFKLALPGSPMTRLAIETPAGLEITADRGIVSQTAGNEPDTSRWTVELGGHNQVNLRVITEEAARQRRPLTLLRQSVTYDLSPRGMELRAQMQLDIHGEGLQRIAVDLDPTLRLVAARYGELQVPFVATENVETRMSHVVLELPEPISGTGRVLQLSAIAPLAVGKVIRLPGLRPEGMAWQEGTATLLIPGELVLERLSTDGCRQSRTAALPAPASGESIEIQYYRPGGTVDVLLKHPREQFKIDTGALVEVGANELTSRLAVEISLARGTRRFVHAELNPSWTIDAVEDLATNRPLAWELEELIPDVTHVKIRPDAPVSAEVPARLLVRGHRALPTPSAFDARELEMLSFDQSPGRVRLISVRGAEGMELHWSGPAALERLDPVQLSPAELRLFPQPPGGFLFAADSSFAQSTVALERRQPTYAADIRIDAAVQDKVLTETYIIQCVPETSRVDRLLVRLSQARDAPLDWKLAGGNSGQFAARRISAGEQAQVGLPEGGEAWEVSLNLARPGAFELRAVRETELSDETPVALASIGQASAQRGTLTVRALGDSGLSIRNRRLSSVPAELLESDRYQTARATYHYQPARDDLGADAAVSIAPAAANPAESGAWVWSSRLDSRFAAASRAIHWATLRIQTAGQQRVRVTLPSQVQLQDAWLDDQRLPLVLAEGDEAGFAVDLPAGRSFATLSLYYATDDGLPLLAGSCLAPFPAVDIPVMERHWNVWLPPGYEVADSSAQYPIDSMTSLSLTSRLFGGLGRSAREKVFNPLAADDWQQLTSGRGDLRLAREAGREFAQTMAALVSDYLAGEGESELTWGQLLAMCSDVEAKAGRMLLVDVDSLSWLRLGPRVRVRFQPGDSPLTRGVALLEQANLALLAQGDVLVVTSAAAAAAAARQLAPPDQGILFPMSPGPLSDELQRARDPASSSRFQTVAVWRAVPERGPSPWTTVDPANHEAGQAHDWNPYSLHLSQAGTPRLRVVRRAAMVSLGWTIFLGTVAIGLWRWRERPAELCLAGSLAAIAAVLLPAAYAPLASAVLLAALFCLLLYVTRIPRRPARESSVSHHSSRARMSVAHQLAVLAIVAALVNLGAVLVAQQPAASQPSTPSAAPSDDASTQPATVPADQPASGESEPATPPRGKQPVYEVLVPLDDERQVADDKYYLPDELYKQLHRLAASASGRPKGWLIRRASYRGTLARDPLTKQLLLTGLSAIYELQVLQSKADVQLPFPREAGANPIAGARLDGRAIDVEWNADGDTIEVGSLAADRYRLELDLRAPTREFLNSTELDLPIPPIAGAALELTIPNDAPTIELPHARGEVRTDKERGQLHAQLGGCERLTVRWPVGIGMESAPANLQVEELIWVKVRPGTTVFDARFKYRVLEGGVRQIRLLADPRLRLLPPTTSPSPVAAVHTVPGDPQYIDLELARTVTDQVVIDLSFLLTGTSGVGNLQLPRLESRGARATRRWLAASADPALQSKELPGEDCRPLAIGDYMAAWGTADARPQAAYSIPRGEAMWVLSTQPGEPRTSVEQTMTVSLGSGAAQVNFDAALTIAGGYLFQLRLQAPPGLDIEAVSLLEDDVERVARWSIDETGLVTVFLSSPITGRQQFKLRGHLEASAPDAVGVPRLELAGAEIKRNQWRVYRQSAVLVDVSLPAGVSTVEEQVENAPSDFGSLVGCYASDQPQAMIVAKVAPNVPRSKMVAVTVLQRDGDRWMAELTCRVKVLEGVLDALVFEVPSQWSEPYRVDPKSEVKLVSVPGESRRQMIVVPERPIDGDYELKIRGRVALSAGDRLRVPDIIPQRTQQVDRFVVLPQHVDLQRVAWETVGLSRATLPAEFAVAGRSESTAVVYQVAAESFQASLTAVPRAAAVARVGLADIQIRWQPDGHYQGTAAFDVEPAGATSCVLQMPVDSQLLHASIESLPVQLASLGENRWRVSLGPAELPQRLELVYSGTLHGPSTLRRFAAPRLVDLEVESTLWTIHAPSQTGEFRTRDGLEPLTPAARQLRRLRGMAALVKLPPEVVGKHLPEEIARWYRPWKVRYSEARAALNWELTVAGRSSDQSPEALEARRLDAAMDGVEAQLGTPRPAGRKAVQGDAPAELLTAATVGTQPASCAINGPSYELQVGYPQAPSDGWLGRIGMALAFAFFGAAGTLGLRTRRLPKFAPGLVLIVAGAAWWLLLAPSIAGLAAVFVGIVAVVRGRELPGDDSE